MKYKDLMCSCERDVSLEYNAFDWPRFFLGTFNSWYRAITNNSVIKRDGVLSLTGIFQGKATTFGDCVQIVFDGLSAAGHISMLPLIIASGPLNAFIGGVQIGTKIVTGVGGIINRAAQQAAEKNSFKSLGYNPYYHWIIQADKRELTKENLKEAKFAADFLASLVSKLDKMFPVVTPRKCNVPELNTLKLWRPKEVASDLEEAKRIYIAAGKEWESIYNNFANSIGKFVKFIEDSIVNDF